MPKDTNDPFIHQLVAQVLPWACTLPIRKSPLENVHSTIGIPPSGAHLALACRKQGTDPARTLNKNNKNAPPVGKTHLISSPAAAPQRSYRAMNTYICYVSDKN